MKIKETKYGRYEDKKYLSIRNCIYIYPMYNTIHAKNNYVNCLILEYEKGHGSF